MQPSGIAGTPAAQMLSTPGPLALAVSTAVAGYTLVNGTGTVLAWTAPADGLLHRFTVMANMHVTSAETSGQGQVTIAFTLPDGFATTHTLFNAGAGTGDNGQASVFTRVVQAGSTVTIAQATALTAGAAVMWAEIWAL